MARGDAGRAAALADGRVKRLAAALICAAFAALGVLGFAFTASAHEWVTDGNITVLLHINPNDNPVAGELAELLFSVNDSTGRFASGACKCAVTVSESGTTLLNEPLLPFPAAPELYNYYAPLVFPKPGVYHIVMTGSPAASGTFQNFTVAYDERVEPGPYDYSSADIAAIAATLAVIAAALYFVYRQMRPRKKE